MNRQLQVVVAALFCAIFPAELLSAAESGARDPDPVRALAEIGDRWFEASLEAGPFYATQVGDHRFDDRFDLSIRDDVRARFGAVSRSP